MAGPGWDPGFGNRRPVKIRATDYLVHRRGLGVSVPVEGTPGHTCGLTRLFCHRQGGCFNPRLTRVPRYNRRRVGCLGLHGAGQATGNRIAQVLQSGIRLDRNPGMRVQGLGRIRSGAGSFWFGYLRAKEFGEGRVMQSESPILSEPARWMNSTGEILYSPAGRKAPSPLRAPGVPPSLTTP